MKILPKEPDTQRLTVRLLEISAYIHFFVISIIAYTLISRVISQVWSLIISIIAGFSVCFIEFAFVGVLKDIHSIKVNTDGYETEYEQMDYDLLVQSMQQMNENMVNIQEMLYALHPEIFEGMNDKEESDEMEPDQLLMTDQEDNG